MCLQEIELITADFKDAEHFVHALLMCCQPCHKVERIRIAQSPLIAERPWERAHRILYDSPSHNQLFDPAQSPAGVPALHSSKTMLSALVRVCAIRHERLIEYVLWEEKEWRGRHCWWFGL